MIYYHIKFNIGKDRQPQKNNKDKNETAKNYFERIQKFC